MPVDPEFLSEQDILLIHTELIAEFGGAQGVRDPGLLASALAQPSATSGGTFLHRGLHEMAAAYLYHIARNHAFIDGNKRTALIACLTFLDLNGVHADRREPALFDLTVAVADGRIGKDAIAERLRSYFPLPGEERTP